MVRKSKILLSVLLVSALSFCLPLWAAEGYGVFNVVKGVVKVKNGKTGEVVNAKIGGKVFPKDTIITEKDARAKIVMVDKNVINVSPESQVVFQTYEFAPAENKKNVLLDVIYGKVRSKVEQKYDGAQNKFQVKTPAAVAGVRGTDFMAGFSEKTKKTDIVTFEGKVEFGLPGANGKIENPVMVGAGEMAQANFGVPPTPPIPVPEDKLAEFDSESKADAPGTKGTSDDQRAPADDDKGKKDDEKGMKDGDADRDNGKGNNDSADNGEKGMKDGNSDRDNGIGNNKDDGGGSVAGSAPAPGMPADGSESSGDIAPPPMTDGAANLPPPRDPASTGDMGISGGTMLMPEDFAPPTNEVVLLPPTNIYIPPTFIPPTQDQLCPTCQDIIQGGSTQLIIKINTQ